MLPHSGIGVFRTAVFHAASSSVRLLHLVNAATATIPIAETTFPR
jgi:hypothetical protein